MVESVHPDGTNGQICRPWLIVQRVEIARQTE